MKIHDLESFKLSDTVKFHDTLNPNLFTDEKMQDDVRERLLLIAEDFINFMGIDTLEVADIRLYGSNAAYTYTTKSDIDLHVLVDMTDIADDEVYRELFNSKKQLYNDSLNITIHGMPVELYMQDANQPVKSLGDYSISRDKWVKFPTKSKASFEETSVIEKFKRLVVLSELALRSDDIDLLDELIDTIRRYRKAGLEHGGEFSPENLAYKSLRNRGVVEKLYDYRDKLHSEYLSIDEALSSESSPQEDSPLMAEFRQFKVTETFDKSYNIEWEEGQYGDWDAIATLNDGTNLSINFNFIGGKSFQLEFWRNGRVEVTGDGDAQRVFATVLEAIKEFIIKVQPTTLTFSASKEVEPGQNSQSRVKLYDRLTQRYASQLGYSVSNSDAGNAVYYKLVKRRRSKLNQSVSESFDKPYNIQWEKGDHGDWDALAQLPDGSPLSIMFNQRKGATGEKVVEVEFYRNNSQEVTLEGDAQRVFATVLFAMQQYVKKYRPPTMVFGASKLTDPSVMYEPGKPQPNPESRAKLYDRLVQRYAKDWGYRAVRSGNRDLVIYELSRINKEIAESSGYIPSESEKNDPRFSRALSVDVHPQTMKRQAKDMGLGNIARDGRPQRLSASGKFTR